MTQQTNLALKKLKGIKPKGVKLRDDTNLEVLLSVEQKVFERFYACDTESEQKFYLDLIQRSDDRRKFYGRSFREILSGWLDDLFRDFCFSEQDLTDYIFTRSGDDDLKFPDSLITGFYSGCLLSRLTDQNQQQNKQTEIVLSGVNNSFNYLFYFAKNLDRLFVDGFRGYRLCSHLGDFGTFNVCSITNCKGDYVADQVKSDQENPRLFVLVNHKGNDGVRNQCIPKGGLFVSYGCEGSWAPYYSDAADYAFIGERINEIISGESVVRPHQPHFRSRQKITKKLFNNNESFRILNLTKEISKSSPEEIVKLANEIYNINKQRYERE